MTSELSTANEVVAAIDLLIDANHAAVQLRMHAALIDCWGWGNAWDRCPDLKARERSLFLRRDAARNEVYRLEAIAERATQRKARNDAKKRAVANRNVCIKCGTLLAA